MSSAASAVCCQRDRKPASGAPRSGSRGVRFADPRDTNEFASSSSRAGAADAAAGGGRSSEESSGPLSWLAPSPSQPDNVAAAEARKKSQSMSDDRLQKMTAAAAAVRTLCKKYPTGGGGLMALAKMRFFAAVPDEEGNDRVSLRGVTMSDWRRGRLGYWENEKAFLQKEKPKGHVSLLNISKVSAADTDSAEVIVTYQNDGERTKLRLQFPDAGAASRWKEAMRTLRGFLQ